MRKRPDNKRRIDRVINNNVVTVLDEAGNETVLMGKGIGFQKKFGDELETSKIEKTFILSDGKKTTHLIEMAGEIPYEYMKISSDIVSYARISLNKELDESIYLTLTDHLNFAINRIRQGIELTNSMLWEIKHYYSHEYMIGLEALTIIKNHTGLELRPDEAGFIAMHILNAELDLNMHTSKEMTKMIQNVLNIVKYHFCIQIDEESLDYERFVTHLKFFIQRAMHGKNSGSWDKELMDMICKQYREAYCCAEKVKEYIERTTPYQVVEEEMVYLSVHIQRLWCASEQV